MTGAEHLAWAKARAEDYTKQNRCEMAFLTFVSDLAKHPATGPLVTMVKMREGNALVLADRMTNPERVEKMQAFIAGFQLTFRIDFADVRAGTVFASMAEGMEECRRDDDETERADLLEQLADHVWQKLQADADARFSKDAAFFIELPVTFHEAATDVLENALDNNSGIKPEDDDAEYHLFIGDVTIDPEKLP